MNTKVYDVLLGKIATNVVNNQNGELIFEFNDGSKYKFYHSQDCCESVSIEDICGNLDDLIGEPILQAEEVIHENETPVECLENDKVKDGNYRADSYTWTFYKFATIKGYVTVRWFGESNGYYSESVDFAELEKPNETPSD